MRTVSRQSPDTASKALTRSAARPVVMLVAERKRVSVQMIRSVPLDLPDPLFGERIFGSLTVRTPGRAEAGDDRAVV